MSDMWPELKADGTEESALEYSKRVYGPNLNQPKNLMTGQEWYDKFKAEYKALAPRSYAKDFYAKKAAQNTAGIKDF